MKNVAKRSKRSDRSDKARRITADFVLDMYEQSKSLSEKERSDRMQIIISLSKNIGNWYTA